MEKYRETGDEKDHKIITVGEHWKVFWEGIRRQTEKENCRNKDWIKEKEKNKKLYEKEKRLLIPFLVLEKYVYTICNNFETSWLHESIRILV